MFSGISGLEIFFVFVSLIISMTLHEAMHGFTAHWLGDTTALEQGRLTLNPLKHIDTITTVLLPLVLIIAGLPPFFAAKPVPFNPDRVKYDEWGAAMIGLAGPLTNLALAGVGALILQIFSANLTSTIYNAFIIFTEVNVAFFVINMIPWPPLDGSRVLYAFAPEPVQEFMMNIERMGFTAIIIFFVVFITVLGTPIINIENSILRLLLG